ncbi:hypothetical protein GCM10017562_46960 [Streptomyces roseofulvus]
MAGADVGGADVGAGEDGFPSPDVAVGTVVGAVDAPPPPPAAWAVQPVTASATAAVARTALRMAEERFMVAPREMNCVHRDASRAPVVAHLCEQALML